MGRVEGPDLAHHVKALEIVVVVAEAPVSYTHLDVYKRQAEGKAECKRRLQEQFGLAQDGSPVMAMVTRLVGHKGVDLVRDVAEGDVYKRQLTLSPGAGALHRAPAPSP